MNKKLGAYIFLGLVIGAIFGTMIGISNGRPALNAGLGALTGTFIGWFFAIVGNQKSRRKKATQKARRRR